MRDFPIGVRRQLDAIRDLLHGPHRNIVLPVVGAGLSIPHLPGWRQILEELIADASPEHREALEESLRLARFLDVAAFLEVDPRVTGVGIAAAIKRNYARPRMQRPKIYDLVARLPVAHFVTTNFDPWLKDAVSSLHDAAPRVYTPFDEAAWNDIGPSSAPMVLMLHGDADRPSTCVLSAAAFRRLIHRNAAFRAGFSGLIAGRSLLFLGHSLRDPDLVLMLESWESAMTEGASAAQPPHHYLLTTEIDVIERRRLLELGVQPVECGPPRDYSWLPDVLDILCTPPASLDCWTAVDAVARTEMAQTDTRELPAAHDQSKWDQVNRVVDVYRLLLSGNDADAATTLSRAIGEFGQTAPLLSVQSVLMSRSGAFDVVNEIARAILQHSRGDIAKAEEALHHHTLGDSSRAIIKTAEALIEDPTNILAWLVRGWVLTNEDSAKALRNIDAALLFIRLYQAWAHRLRAQILLRLDQPEQALQAASSGIEMTPHSPASYDTRSSVLLRLNRSGEALADLDNAIRLSPKWGAPRRMKAAVLADLRRHEEAIAAATDALLVGGDDTLMLQIRAESLMTLRKYREAWADVERARKLEPESQRLTELADRLAKKMGKV